MTWNSEGGEVAAWCPCYIFGALLPQVATCHKSVPTTHLHAVTWILSDYQANGHTSTNTGQTLP